MRKTGLKHYLNILFEGIIIVLTIGVAVEVPLLFAYNTPISGGIILFEIFITLVFTADIFHNIFISYSGNSAPSFKRKRHFYEYLRGWVWIDLIAAIPFILIIPVLTGNNQPDSVFTFFYFLRTIKLFRIAQIIKKISSFYSINTAVLRLVMMLFWVMIASHFISCGWVFLETDPGEADSLTRYIKAYYWTMTTIATVGYGDITPKNNIQMVYTIMVEMFGAGMFGFVIGNIANVIASIDVTKTQFREKIDKINTFLKYRNIPPDLQDRINDYYAYLWETRRGHDEASVLIDLPVTLKTRLSLFLNKDIIEKVPIFKGASNELIKAIILKLEPMVFMPGDIIVEKGEVGHDMFFISKGMVDVVSEDGKIVYATLTAGQFFGEIALLLSMPRTATIKAKDYCDLYRLDKDTFYRVLKRYPDFARNIKDLAEKRRREISPEDIEGEEPETEDSSSLIIEEKNLSEKDKKAEDIIRIAARDDFIELSRNEASSENTDFPGKVTVIGGNSDGKSITVNWEHHGKEVHYELIKFNHDHNKWKILASSILQPPFTDNNPTEGNNSYRIRAVNMAGPGMWSPTIKVHFEKKA